MRRLGALLCALVFFAAASARAEDAHTVIYFYENYCESCTPEEDFSDYFQSLTGFSLEDCDYTAYNIARSDGQEALAGIAAELGLTDPAVPLVVVDGVAYSGAGEMENRLPEDALSWDGETNSTVVYLYVPACESCARAVKVLDALPGSVTIRRGNVSFESSVVVERIDVSAQTGVAQRLFDAYEVPDEQRVTPCVFLPERYLSGADAIEENLSDMVALGWAVGCVEVSAEQESAEASSESRENVFLSLAGTVGAGLTAGVNTCALSMLLLFLSILLENRHHARLLAACFLLAKFVCYLLIGFVLLGVLQRFNPHWLQPLAKGVLTGLGALLIALNLWDAWQAHRENYGKIRNQLPLPLRRRLHSTIRAMTQKRVLIPATMALGFLVALGEFLCAGQLYLMRLLSDLQSEAGVQVLNLIVYCAAFIVPSAVLSAVVLRGRSQARVSAFLADHMVAAKLITAAAMLLLILSAWLL